MAQAMLKIKTLKDKNIPRYTIYRSYPFVMRSTVIHAAGVFRVSLVIDGSSSVFVREKFLDFPIPLLGADTEFKIFLRDRIPILTID